jgi:hypothetical protein
MEILLAFFKFFSYVVLSRVLFPQATPYPKHSFKSSYLTYDLTQQPMHSFGLSLLPHILIPFRLSIWTHSLLDLDTLCLLSSAHILLHLLLDRYPLEHLIHFTVLAVLL